MAADPALALRKQVLAAVRARLKQYDMKQGNSPRNSACRARAAPAAHRAVQAFSLEALVRVATRTGLTVRLSVTRPYAQD